MKALAAFLFKYSDTDLSSEELRLIYEDGFFEINDTMKWYTFDTHYTLPKNAFELIEYHRGCANWKEIEL